MHEWQLNRSLCLCRHLSGMSLRGDLRQAPLPPVCLHRQHQVHPPGMVCDRQSRLHRFPMCLDSHIALPLLINSPRVVDTTLHHVSIYIYIYIIFFTVCYCGLNTAKKNTVNYANTGLHLHQVSSNVPQAP